MQARLHCQATTAFTQYVLEQKNRKFAEKTPQNRPQLEAVKYHYSQFYIRPAHISITPEVN